MPASTRRTGYLTELTTRRMERVVAMYRDLRAQLITKDTNSGY